MRQNANRDGEEPRTRDRVPHPYPQQGKASRQLAPLGFLLAFAVLLTASSFVILITGAIDASERAVYSQLHR